MSEANRFCSKCGASLPANASYCLKCGTAVSSSTTSPPLDWREQRRQSRAQRRAERHGWSGLGGVVIGIIFIVLGVAIFIPTFPWQDFWGFFLIVLGLGILYLRFIRSRGGDNGQPH